MTTLLNMLLVNAVVVIPLAIVVWGASRLAKRPALTHVLWVLVLLKLITPPFFRLPISVAIPLASSAASARIDSSTGRSSVPDPVAVTKVNLSKDIAVSTHGTSGSTVGDRVAPERLAVTARTSAAASESAFQPTKWLRTARGAAAMFLSWSYSQPILRWMLLAIWILGTIFWFALQAIRAVRFWRWIQQTASRDPKLQQQARQLANRFALRSCPQVVVVEAQLSPMLWGYGWRSRLLFPADLARRLDHEARGTLLAHELAHFSRGDHWIRILELFVTGIFWWHPVVWLARHRIEESEEECCDAWVVSEFPHAPRRYAEALLDTIDFLCDPPTAMPPLASGLGPAAFLRRRLTRIMEGVSPKELSPRQRCGVLCIALLALPLQPFVLGSSAELPTPPIRPPNAATEIRHMEPVQDRIASTATPQPNSEPAPTPNQSKLAPMFSNRAERGARIWGKATSSSGRFAVHVMTDRRVVLVNVATGDVSDLSQQGLTSVAFLPDGKSFVAGGNDGHVTIWSAETGSVTRTIFTHDSVVRSVAVAPRGDLVAIGGRDGSVHLLDLEQNLTVAELPRAESAVNCVRFSPDGRCLAVAIGDWESTDAGQVAIWDLDSGRVESALTCESAPGAVCFASNDELIVGQWNGQASLWNLVSRKVVASALADKEIVSAASFSPDNPGLLEVRLIAANQPIDVGNDQATSPISSFGSTSATN